MEQFSHCRTIEHNDNDNDNPDPTTFEPSPAPTNRPTKGTCIDEEFIAFITISFGYIDHENKNDSSSVPSSEQINNILANITNKFIETEINERIDCKMNNYYNNIIIDEEADIAAINISICFDCNGNTFITNDYNDEILGKDFVTIFEQKTTTLIVIANSTQIQVSILSPDGRVSDKISTLTPTTTIETNKAEQYYNNMFWSMTAIIIGIILTCIACLCCVFRHKIKKHRQLETDTHIAMITVPGVKMRESGANLLNSNQIGTDIKDTISIDSNDEMNDIKTSGNIINDDEFIINGDDNDNYVVTPSNPDIGNDDEIIIGDDNYKTKQNDETEGNDPNEDITDSPTDEGDSSDILNGEVMIEHNTNGYGRTQQ